MQVPTIFPVVFLLFSSSLILWDGSPSSSSCNGARFPPSQEVLHLWGCIWDQAPHSSLLLCIFHLYSRHRFLNEALPASPTLTPSTSVLSLYITHLILCLEYNIMYVNRLYNINVSNYMNVKYIESYCTFPFIALITTLPIWLIL